MHGVAVTFEKILAGNNIGISTPIFSVINVLPKSFSSSSSSSSFSWGEISKKPDKSFAPPPPR